MLLLLCYCGCDLGVLNFINIVLVLFGLVLIWILMDGVDFGMMLIVLVIFMVIGGVMVLVIYEFVRVI